MTAITNLTGEIAPGAFGPIPLKAQLASDDSGNYVLVVALDQDTGVTIGAVSQAGSWTVTADAGTNLNTSALALETGGNLATIATAQGAGGTGISEPTGGTGILGWLSGIYKALTSALSVQQPTASSLNATVVGTGTFAVQQPDLRATGQTINSATLNAAYTVSLANGEGIIGFQVTGLTASGATLTIEATVDGGTTWNSTNGFGSSSGTLFTTLTADQGFRVNVGGRTGIRLRVSSTGTGTITISSSASSANDLVGISSPLPTGSNTIGAVTPAPSSSSSIAVTPGASSALEASHVLKSSAGNLYSLYVLTTSASGYLMTFNATSAPSNGAVTPVECIPVNAASYAEIDFSGAPPDRYSTGIVAVFSTTGPFTLTTSATAFFKWRVQ
jgi:hypothetical protein